MCLLESSDTDEGAAKDKIDVWPWTPGPKAETVTSKPSFYPSLRCHIALSSPSLPHHFIPPFAATMLYPSLRCHIALSFPSLPHRFIPPFAATSLYPSLRCHIALLLPSLPHRFIPPFAAIFKPAITFFMLMYILSIYLCIKELLKWSL